MEGVIWVEDVGGLRVDVGGSGGRRARIEESEWMEAIAEIDASGSDFWREAWERMEIRSAETKN